ncbi:MAG TPA: DUF4870 domain-containing protein [Streptosporangiaceae bacterium]|nr:DUF4870 domain-containing protein [Streptosporangiaceae bacterium]
MTAGSDQVWDAGSGLRATSGGFLARSGAVCGYLVAGLASFVPPLAIYLLVRRNSTFLRTQLAQAANAAITTAVYALCSAIIGALLALDSVYLGLRVAITGAMFAWVVTFGYLAAAALAACRGRFYPIPACLCATLLRPASHSAGRSAGRASRSGP